MSLAVLALRIAAVKALIGNTSAGTRVFDSVVEPRALLDDAAQPVIVVYTDAGRINAEGRELFGAPQIVDLSFELFVARAVTVKDSDGRDVEIPATDTGYETYLRCLAYEILKVLLTGDGAWARLFRRLWFRASEQDLSEWGRGAHAEKGRRFAFLDMVYKVETLADPIPGAPLQGVFADVVAAMESDPDLASVGAYLRALVEQPGQPSWRRAQSELGLLDQAVRGIGIVPDDGAGDAETGEAPAATEATGEDRIGDGDLTVGVDQATWTPADGDPVPLAEPAAS